MIVTFYSYKGGVGRSMALANVACQLANKHGLRVLVIDWDLEAPGLHFYFGHRDAKLRNRKGLIDLVEATRAGREPALKNYVMKPAPEITKHIKFGSIEIIPCGRLDEYYMERVAEFSWSSFYDDGDGFERLQYVKEQIQSHYDICLIDARAGQSETNVPATSQLADVIIFLFTSNNQNVSGTEDVCRRLHAARRRQSLEQIPVVLAPSRVFPNQPSYQKWLNDVAEPMYQRLVESGALDRRHQPNGITQVTLPVEPAVAAGEQLPILRDEASAAGLLAGYRELADLLLDHKADEDLLWRPERVGGRISSDERIGKLRQQLSSAALRGDEVGAAATRLRLARYLREAYRLAEAESLALASLTHFTSRKDKPWQALAFHTLAQVSCGRERYDEAIKRYRQALDLIEKSETSVRSVILHDLGVAHLEARELDVAEKLLRETLELRERLDDRKGIAMTVHQLGNLAFSRHDHRRAQDFFSEAIEAALSVSDESGAAISYHQLGNVFAADDRLDRATEMFERAVKLHEKTGAIRGPAISRRRIGDILLRQGEPERALGSYTEALNAAQIADDVRNSQVLHRRIGSIYERKASFEEAKLHYSAALSLADEAGFETEILKNLKALIRIEEALDNTPETRRLASRLQRLELKGDLVDAS